MIKFTKANSARFVRHTIANLNFEIKNSRCFSLGIGLKERDKLGFERLPSFAEIKAVQLDKYLQELGKSNSICSQF